MTARHRILETALAVITERGLSGVTMAGVADAAGVARQTLYNHFPDIDSIVTAVLERHAAAALEQLETLLAAAPDVSAQLDQLVRHGVAASDHTRGAPVTGLSAEARQRVAEHVADYRRLIGGVVAAGVDEGIFRSDLDPKAAAVVIHRMIEIGAELAAEMGGTSAAAGLLADMIRAGLSDPG